MDNRRKCYIHMVSYTGLILDVPANYCPVDVVYDMAGYHSRKATEDAEDDEDDEDEMNQLGSDMEKQACLTSQRKPNGKGTNHVDSFTKTTTDVGLL